MDDTTRDQPFDMATITERLGEPDTTYRSNPRSTAWRLTLGLIIVVAACALHFYVWSNPLPPFRVKHLKLWILIGLAMTVGPSTGAYLIYFAIRGMKMWVLEYPTGLFVWHRGEVVALPWDELASITFKGLPNKAPLVIVTDETGTPTRAGFDLTRSPRRLFGTELVLTRDDGASVTLSSVLTEFPMLGDRIQQRLFERHFAEHLQRFRDGETVAYGMVACHPGGLQHVDKLLPWGDVAKIERLKDKYNILQQPKGKLWQMFDIAEVTNLHLFLTLAKVVMGNQPTE